MVHLPNKVIRTTRHTTPADRKATLAWLREYNPNQGYTVAFYDGAMLNTKTNTTCKTLTAECTCRGAVVTEEGTEPEKFALLVKT
jgi:hypothetical protein